MTCGGIIGNVFVDKSYCAVSPPLSTEPELITLIYRRAAAGAPSKWSPYTLQVGDWCDARDSVNTWCVGQIVECNDNAVKVHFKGWASKWDEVIPRSSPRLAELRHHTAGLDTGCSKRVQGAVWDISAEQLNVLSQRLAGSHQLSAEDRDVLWNAELPSLVERLLSSSYCSSSVIAAVSVVLRDIITLLVGTLKDVCEEFTPGKQQMLCRLVGIDHTCSYFYDTYGHLPGVASPDLQVDASLFEGPVCKVAKSSHRLIPLSAAPAVTSRLLVINLNHFALQGGFDGILLRMQRADTSLILVHTLVAFLRGISTHIQKKFLSNLLQSFQELLMKYLYSLQTYSLKAVSDRNSDIVDSILREFEHLMKSEAKEFPLYETIEKFKLHYCLVQLSSPLLNLRLRGVNLLTDIIEAVRRREASKKGYASYYLNYGTKASEPACHWLTSAYLTQWLQHSDVLGLLFGDTHVMQRYNLKDTHDEILRRSGDVLVYLAERNVLSQNHLETLWKHTEGAASTCSVIYKLLIAVVPKLQPTLLSLLITYMHELTSSLDEAKVLFIQAVVDGVLASGHQCDSQENGLDILWSTCFDSDASESLRKVSAASLVSALSKPPAKRQLLLYMEKCISAVQKCSTDANTCARVICELIDAQSDPNRLTSKGGAMTKVALLEVCCERYHVVEAAVSYIKHALNGLKDRRTTSELETLSVGVHLLQFIYANSSTLMMEFAFLYELWLEFISAHDWDAMEIFYGFVESICPEDVPVAGVAYNPNGSFYSNNKLSTPSRTISTRSKCCLDETSLYRVLMEVIGAQVKKARVYQVPLGPAGFATLERLFRRVNHMQKKVTFGYNRQVFTVIALDIIALDVLVYAYVSATDQSVVSQASNLIVNLQMKLASTVNKRDLWSQFTALCVNLINELKSSSDDYNSSIARLLWLLVKFLREIQMYTGVQQSGGSYSMMAANSANNDAENVRITVFWRKETAKSNNHSNLMLHIPRRKVTVGALRSRIAKDLRWPVNRVRIIHNRKFISDKQDTYLLEDVGILTFIDVVLLQGEADDTSGCIGYPVARTLAEMAGSDQMHTRELISENIETLKLLFSLSSDATADACWTLLEMLPLSKSICTNIATFQGAEDGNVPWSELLCGSGESLEMMYRIRVLFMLLNGSVDIDGFPSSSAFLADFVKRDGMTSLIHILMTHPDLTHVSKLSQRTLCIILQALSLALTNCGESLEDVLSKAVSPVAFTARLLSVLSATVQQVRRPSEANEEEEADDEMRREKLREARRRLRMARNEAYVNHTSMANEGINAGAEHEGEDGDTVPGTAVSSLINLLQRVVVEIPTCVSVLIEDTTVLKDVLRCALLTNSDHSLRHAAELALHQLCAALPASSYLLRVVLVEMCGLLSIACSEMASQCANYFNFLARVIKMGRDSSVFTDELRQELFRVIFDVLEDNEVKETTEDEASPLLQGCLKVFGMLLHYEPTIGKFCSEQNEAQLVGILYSSLLFSLESGCGPRCKNSTTRGFAQAVLKALLLNHDSEGCHFDRFLPLARAHHTLEHKQMMLKSERVATSLPLLVKSKTGYSGLVNPGCVCYMISSLQQLFMMPDFRARVLAIQTAPKPAAEAAEDFITQLQLLFANLQESSLAAVDISPFCRAFKDYEGSPTDILLQQDASEFLTNFFQQIESATMGTPSEHLLRDTVGGVLQNELIANDKISQRPEPFYVLSVGVGEGRSTLEEGLNSFIAGETVDYTWESTVIGENGESEVKKECLPTIKRVSIKTLPNFLIIHLKRFSFDFEMMQQTKLNDRFEFPLVLDMRPYTVDGRGAETSGPADENYLYELSGVVVHYGTANSGHYYSFIKERVTRPSKRGGNWLEFNDNFVTEFDVDDMEEETFGGEIQTTGVQAKMQRGRNAFMLVYDKKVPNVRSDNSPVRSTLDDGKAQPPAHIVNHITSENYEHWRNKCVYTPSYYAFLQDVLLREVAGRAWPPSEHLELVLRVSFGTLVYAREKELVQHWCTWLCYQCKSSCDVGTYVLQFLLRPPVDEKAYWTVYRRVRYLLLYVEDVTIRISVMNVITEAMSVVLSERGDEGSALAEQLVAVIVLMLRDAQLLWKSLEVYFEPISVLALSSQAKCNALLRQGVAGKLLSMFLGSDSPYPELIAGGLTDANKSSRNMTDATASADLRSLVRALSILLANAAVDENSKAAATGSFVLRQEEADMLLHRAFIYRLMKLLAQPNNKPIVFPLLRIIAGVSLESFQVYVSNIYCLIVLECG